MNPEPTNQDQDPPSAAKIRAGLRRIRILRRIFWGMWLGFIPYASTVSDPVGGGPNHGLLAVYGFCWIVLGFVCQTRKCPACGAPFFSRPLGPGSMGSFANGFTSTCMNCGQPLSGRNLPDDVPPSTN